LGIAEINRKVPEASLEWIQVLPNYRRLGIGTALVRELCMRVWPEVDFITVSGKVHSDSQPEKLYRCCGFTGSDVWWLLVA
jgi:ribosomal protein S18 acetylase RimI-like enzyme